jgi:hypothetical protein
VKQAEAILGLWDFAWGTDGLAPNRQD